MSKRQTRPKRAVATPRGRRLRRAIVAASVASVATLYLGCANLSLPVDMVLNLPPNERHAQLEATTTQPTLVVLQHGIWRSWASLWRMERALEMHGYEVLNFSYPSQQGTIQEHAELLHERIEEQLAGRPEPRICFVGHSMGGLVIRYYLQQEYARDPQACLFLGTPQRGAVLCDERKDGWLFRTFMGDQAALQLSPSDPIYTELGPVDCPRVATIIGGCGDDEGHSSDIPGDDDGKVGTVEAHLQGETDSVLLDLNHTQLSHSADVIEHVLRYLKSGSFDGPEREG